MFLADVAGLDVFTSLAETLGHLAALAGRLDLVHRPTDVMCTLLRAMDLLEPGPTLRPTRWPPSTPCGDRRGRDRGDFTDVGLVDVHERRRAPTAASSWDGDQPEAAALDECHLITNCSLRSDREALRSASYRMGPLVCCASSSVSLPGAAGAVLVRTAVPEAWETHVPTQRRTPLRQRPAIPSIGAPVPYSCVGLPAAFESSCGRRCTSSMGTLSPRTLGRMPIRRCA